MTSFRAVEQFRKKLENLGIDDPPNLHVVLGSGFGAALSGWDRNQPWEKKGEIAFDEIPTLVASTTPDHQGKYLVLQHKETGATALAQMGRLHGYEGHPARQVVQTVMIPRMLGVPVFVLTNAAGGLPPEYGPGDVMLIRDHVNLTGQNPLVGENPVYHDGRPLGPRFPDLSTLYDKKITRDLRTHLEKNGAKVHEGVYLGLLGPSFETPAEVALFSRWGLQAVGMSTVWEAIALKHSGASVAAMSLISNLGCGLGDGKPLDHLDILETCRNAAEKIVRGIFDWADKTACGENPLP